MAPCARARYGIAPLRPPGPGVGGRVFGVPPVPVRRSLRRLPPLPAAGGASSGAVCCLGGVLCLLCLAFLVLCLACPWLSVLGASGWPRGLAPLLGCPCGPRWFPCPAGWRLCGSGRLRRRRLLRAVGGAGCRVRAVAAGCGLVLAVAFSFPCRLLWVVVFRLPLPLVCRLVLLLRRVPAVSALSSVFLAPALAGAVPVVALAGSSSLPAGGPALVARVARGLAAAGFRLSVGCCVGADAAVLSAGLPPAALSVFAAFGPGGVGSCSLSAVPAVLSAARAGVAVSWLAGGPLSVPLVRRLAARSAAVLGAASAGCVVLFGSPSSVGSALACRLAVARGLPLVAFPLGFSATSLPLPAAGAWVPVPAVPGAFLFVFSQAGLF